jgi:hypothetical protein
MTSPGALRAKAAEIRQLAATSNDRSIQAQLLGLAERFEQLADQAGKPSVLAAAFAVDGSAVQPLKSA